jgi:hypothetical protein
MATYNYYLNNKITPISYDNSIPFEDKLPKGTRVINRFNHKIGRIVEPISVGNVHTQFYSVAYDDNTFDIRLTQADFEVLPEVSKVCMMPIDEQESLMHMIYDVIHIGVSITSLYSTIETITKKYNIKEILNSRLKNEKYSDSRDYPLAKVIYENKGISNDLNTFFKNKMITLRYLISQGANVQTLKESYMNNSKFDLDFLLQIGRIDVDIYDFLKSLLK